MLDTTTLGCCSTVLLLMDWSACTGRAISSLGNVGWGALGGGGCTQTQFFRSPPEPQPLPQIPSCNPYDKRLLELLSTMQSFGTPPPFLGLRPTIHMSQPAGGAAGAVDVVEHGRKPLWDMAEPLARRAGGPSGTLRIITDSGYHNEMQCAGGGAGRAGGVPSKTCVASCCCLTMLPVYAALCCYPISTPPMLLPMHGSAPSANRQSQQSFGTLLFCKKQGGGRARLRTWSPCCAQGLPGLRLFVHRTLPKDGPVGPAVTGELPVVTGQDP